MADLKLDLLIKVMLLTGSETDGEALAALRRANVLLRNAGTDWRELLLSKVTVVADPFGEIPAPAKPVHQPTSYASPPTYQRPRPRPRPPQFQCDDCQQHHDLADRVMVGSYGYCRTCYAQNHSPTRPQPLRANNYAGRCFTCDIYIPARAGLLYNGHGFTNKPVCTACDAGIKINSINPANTATWPRNKAKASQPRQAASEDFLNSVGSKKPQRRGIKMTTDDIMKDIDF